MVCFYGGALAFIRRINARHAAITHIPLGSKPVHGVSAVGADHEPRKKIRLVLRRRNAGSPGKPLMHNGELFFGDDRRMGPFHDGPFAFVRQRHLLAAVGHALVLALHHISDIDLVGEDGFHGVNGPGSSFRAVFIMGDETFTAVTDFEVSRRHDLHGVETLCDPAGGHAFLIPVKDPPDDFRLLLIDHQLVTVVGVLLITEGRIVAGKLPALALHGQGTLDFDGKLPDVVVVDNISKGDNGAAVASRVLHAVQIVQDGNHPDTLLGKIVLHEPAQLRVITTQSGIVFEDDAVDFPALNVPQQILIAGTVKIAACIPVVRIDRHGQNLFALITQVLNMLLIDAVLILDAVALRFVSVLLAQAVVFSHPPLDFQIVWLPVLFVLHKGHNCSFLPNK